MFDPAKDIECPWYNLIEILIGENILKQRYKVKDES